MAFGVFGYQIGIFLVIYLSARGGRKLRNKAIFWCSIWTLTHIFAPWLFILQFGTIFLAWIFSDPKEDKKPFVLDKYKDLDNYK